MLFTVQAMRGERFGVRAVAARSGVFNSAAQATADAPAKPRSFTRIFSGAFTRIFTVSVIAASLQVIGAGNAAADPPSNVWAKLRMCESSGRYETNTGNGYFGAYQFNQATWASVGGAGQPHRASPKEQDYRALYLYRMRGWQPWTCAKMLGLREDRDARSKRKPSYQESAYIGGSPVLPPIPLPPAGPKPVWPGVVYAPGDCAPALKTFQLRMNVYGYGFSATGCYYEKTKQAVLDLQRANGINPSGRLGPKTWDAAWNGKPPR